MQLTLAASTRKCLKHKEIKQKQYSVIFLKMLATVNFNDYLPMDNAKPLDTVINMMRRTGLHRLSKINREMRIKYLERSPHGEIL